jgi:HAD superfamily hydrolase (TIGR01662 family)
MVRAVAFDLGDTLWHFPYPRPMATLARAHVGRLRTALERLDADPEAAPALQERLLGEWDRWEREADAAGGAGPDYLARAAEVAAEFGLPAHAAAALWQCMALGGPFLGRQLLAGTHDTLEALREAGYRLAVITNRAHGDEAFLEELDAYGLRAPFDVIVSSDQVGYRKPHPRIFEVALEALDLEPSQVTMVGDRPEADVAGANRLGMPSIWTREVTPPHRVPEGEEQRPDYVIDRIAELIELDLLR